MITLSLCMIVKNEEAVLGRILEQMKDIADEMIIVDTGSQDGTKKIAENYTDQVYDYAWREDFAAARNFACEKARMDYWMWLDADDAITEENREGLKELKKTLNPETDMVMMKYLTGFDQNGEATFYYYRERLVKNHRGYRWEGRVHEAVAFRGRVEYEPIEIQHRKQGEGDPGRNLRIYESMLAAGEKLEPRHQFYYGRELYYHKKYKKAAKVFRRFLKEPEGWEENKIDACRLLALCFEGLGKEEKRRKALFYSFLFDVPRGEICCEIGRTFQERGRYEQAVYWYQRALEAENKAKLGGFCQREYERYIPAMELCVCFDRMGDREQAFYYHQMAREEKPKAAEVQANEAYFRHIREGF